MMRKTFLMVSILIVSFAFSDVRLTNDSGRSELSFSGRNAVCTSDFSGNTYVVWSDDRSGDFEIYYKRRNASSGSWESDTRITNSTGYSRSPAVVVDIDANLHVVWMDNRDGDWEIYWNKWYGSWSGDTRLTSSAGFSGFPDVCADSAGGIAIVWQDERDGNYEIYFRKWTSSGGWSSEVRLTNNEAPSMFPAISAEPGGKYIVVWQDKRDGNWEVYSREYDGSTWGTVTRMTDNPSDSWFPDVSVQNDNTALLVWQDNADGDWDILSRSRQSGTWGSVTPVANTGGQSCNPAVAQNSSQFCIVWQETADDNVPKIMMRRFYGSTWSSTTTITDAGSNSYFPSIATDSSNMFRVVWQDFRDGNHEIYYLPVDELLNTHEKIPDRVGIEIAVAPNPFNEICRISASVPDGTIKIEDITGRVVARFNLNPGNNIILWHTEDIPSGTYFVHCISSVGTDVRSIKLLK